MKLYLFLVVKRIVYFFNKYNKKDNVNLVNTMNINYLFDYANIH